MSRRPARFTKSEVARAIAAAKDQGWARIEITRAGTIVIGPGAGSDKERAEKNEWDEVQ